MREHDGAGAQSHRDEWGEETPESLAKLARQVREQSRNPLGRKFLNTRTERATWRLPRCTYAGGAEDFLRTPLQLLVGEIEAGTLPVTVRRVFKLDEIVEAHRCMGENKAAGTIVVLT